MVEDDNSKKNKIFLKKSIDNRESLWYTSQAVAKSGSEDGPWKLNNESKYKAHLKKCEKTNEISTIPLNE